MLDDAIAKAQRLVAALERQRAELEASPPADPADPAHAALPADQLAAGKLAFDNALASARRMLTKLQEAAAIAPDRFTDTDDSP